MSSGIASRVFRFASAGKVNDVAQPKLEPCVDLGAGGKPCVFAIDRTGQGDIETVGLRKRQHHLPRSYKLTD